MCRKTNHSKCILYTHTHGTRSETFRPSRVYINTRVFDTSIRVCYVCDYHADEKYRRKCTKFRPRQYNVSSVYTKRVTYVHFPSELIKQNIINILYNVYYSVCWEIRKRSNRYDSHMKHVVRPLI